MQSAPVITQTSGHEMSARTMDLRTRVCVCVQFVHACMCILVGVYLCEYIYKMISDSSGVWSLNSEHNNCEM